MILAWFVMPVFVRAVLQNMEIAWCDAVFGAAQQRKRHAAEGRAMGRRIAKKLKQRRGASLSMALLLFLVCAVMGSVVLTAATTTNKVYFTVESDQRYFALTSAAELLRQEIQNTVVRADYTAGAAPGGAPTVDWYVLDDGGEPLSDGAGSYLRPDRLAKALAATAIGTAADWAAEQSEYTVSPTFYIQPDRGGQASLRVKASVTAGTGAEARTMTITLQNVNADNSVPVEAATLCIKCTADILKEELSADGTSRVNYTVQWRITDVSR